MQIPEHAEELLRRRQKLLDHIDEGTEQLRTGKGSNFTVTRNCGLSSTAFTPRECDAVNSASKSAK